MGAKVPITRAPSDGAKERRNTEWYDMGVETDLSVAEGLKVVVGQARVDPTGASLFIVVTARIVD